MKEKHINIIMILAITMITMVEIEIILKIWKN